MGIPSNTGSGIYEYILVCWDKSGEMAVEADNI